MRRYLILFLAATCLCGSALSAMQAAAAADRQETLLILTRLLERGSDYDYGKSRAVLVDIERLLPGLIGSPEQLAAEQKLIAQLKTASPGLREFLCRQLRVIGGEASVEPLVALLSNANAASMATYALAQIPGDSVARRLRETVARVPDRGKTGIVFVLGERRDQASLPLITGLLASPNAEVVAAAALAAAKIGTSEALQALTSAGNKASGELKQKILDAQLICAGALASSGKAAEARAFYAALRDSNAEPQFRAAGLRGLVLADPAQAGKLILSTIQSKNEVLIPMAVSLAGRVRDDSELKQIAQALPSLSASNQMRLLGALERSGNRTVLPAVVEAARSTQDGVRIAALRALMVIGDGSAVEAVAAAAAGGGEPVQPVARQTLDRLPGPGVNQKIVELMPGSAPAVQAELARTAGTRGVKDALPVLRKAAASSNSGLRTEAVRSLGKIGLPEDQAALVGMLISNPDQEIEDAIVAIGTREKVSEPVVTAAASTQDPKAKVALMQALGRLADQRGLVIINEALRSQDWALRTGAVRALAQWPSPLPMEQLWQIAVADDDLPRHASALSGYIRMVLESQNKPVAERADLISKAISIARRPEERRQGISALGEMPSMEALRVAVSYYAVEELRPLVRAVVGLISQRYAGPNDQFIAVALQAVAEQPAQR